MVRRLIAGLVAVASLGLAPAVASAEGGGCSNEALREAQHSSFLPDCRAYEMVSPPDKNGAGVMRTTRRTQAAVDGEALKFTSLAAFGDAQGTGISTEYLARRTGAAQTQGWATHAITPPLETTSVKFASQLTDPGYMALSPDLSSGIFRTYSDLTGDPLVEKVQNLYLRNDLLTAGSGPYQLLSACPVCAVAGPLPDVSELPSFADASADLGHVIFESNANLLEGTSGGQPKLYEWDHGTLRVAGILPAAEGGGIAARSRAGQGNVDHRNTLSDGSDGHSRIIFTTEGERGPQYMRVDATTTVLLSASERTDCAGDPTCGGDGIPDPAPDPGGTQPAEYQTASADGTRVFFISLEALTDDAPLNVNHLYMYDASKPDSDPHNLTLVDVSHGAEASNLYGVIGAGRDGSYVYFMDAEQIVAGAPALNGGVGFFVWHDGAIGFIGSSSEAGAAAIQNQLPARHGAGARVTPDGRHLLFYSYSGDGLTGYDHGHCGSSPCIELYLYSADDGSVACVSCNPSGAPASSDASAFSEFDAGGALSTEEYYNHPLSDDGRFAFFQTSEALVPEDTNGKMDVYEYDAATGEPHLISSGTGISDTNFLDATADGKNVFIGTSQALVGWDIDTNNDVYDVRAGGGFPQPQATGAAACEGDACRAQIASPPSVLMSGSASFEGAGNVRAAPAAKAKAKPKPRACSRGRVRKKVRGRLVCVKRKGRSAKRANSASGRGK